VSNPRYAYFLMATASWFLSWGLQAVTLPWLVVEVLRESPERVGLAQGLGQLPALPLLLLGGAAADRLDARRLLLALHGAVGLLFAGLAWLLAAEGLTYPRLLAFALAAGAVNALQHPARDQQLSRVAREFIGRGVAGANLVGQAGQALGALAGAALAFLGAPFVLGLQAALGLAGVLPLAALREPREPASLPKAGAGRPLLAGLGDALRVARRSPVLGPVLWLTSAVGLLFVGPYGVVLPLLVRDVYAGGPREIGLLASMLPVGGIAGGLVLFVRGGVRRNGRALLWDRPSRRSASAASPSPRRWPAPRSPCSAGASGAPSSSRPDARSSTSTRRSTSARRCWRSTSSGSSEPGRWARCSRGRWSGASARTAPSASRRPRCWAASASWPGARGSRGAEAMLRRRGSP
jgi:MFS family permease